MKLPAGLDASRHLNRLLPTRVPFGLRVFFRGAFLLLALATLALAVGVLQDEKERACEITKTALKKTRHKLPPSLGIRQANWCC